MLVSYIFEKVLMSNCMPREHLRNFLIISENLKNVMGSQTTFCISDYCLAAFSIWIKKGDTIFYFGGKQNPKRYWLWIWHSLIVLRGPSHQQCTSPVSGAQQHTEELIRISMASTGSRTPWDWGDEFLSLSVINCTNGAQSFTLRNLK